MRLSVEKVEAQMARRELNPSDIDVLVERPSNWTANALCRVRSGVDLTPRTVGILARALKCDPEDLMADKSPHVTGAKPGEFYE